MKAVLLVIFLAAAYLGLAVAPTVLVRTDGSTEEARHAAASLLRRLEEEPEVFAGLGTARRKPDQFLLRPRRTLLLQSALDPSEALALVSKADFMPGDLRRAQGATQKVHLPRQAQPPGSQGLAASELLTGLPAARALRTRALTSVPPGFDWRIYLAYYPELRGAGVSTEGAAREHYARQGRTEVLSRKIITVLGVTQRAKQPAFSARCKGTQAPQVFAFAAARKVPPLSSFRWLRNVW